jgi:hypothetical protein
MISEVVVGIRNGDVKYNTAPQRIIPEAVGWIDLRRLGNRVVQMTSIALDLMRRYLTEFDVLCVIICQNRFVMRRNLSCHARRRS